jgi:nucleotide-binding universal stress UspA family protein
MYEFEHELGDPGETIVEVAESLAADLVVIGSRGNGGLKRLLPGSVSDAVAHILHCAVLIVR